MSTTPRRRTGQVLTVHALSATGMSLPWPLLLVMVADSTDSGAMLGVAAAARLAPYVALSWWVGRLADRHSRDVIVRSTLVARLALLTGVAAAIATDRAALAVVLASLTVAAATPAYPALAAGMPRLSGPSSQRATELLVTIEVASFVVGPALGGLLLLAPAFTGPAAVALTGAALACYAGVRQPRPEAVRVERRAPFRVTSGPLRSALAAVMLVNAVGSAAVVALLPLAEEQWSESGADAAYGLATALIGFGALGGPLLGLLGGRRGSRRPLAPGLLLVGAALGAVAASPSAWWAAAPLILAGAAAVQVEAAATETIQREAGDDHSAGVLGLADTLMVAAGLVGALGAPILAALIGAVPLLALLGLVSTLPVLAGAIRRGLALRRRAAGHVPLPRRGDEDRVGAYPTLRPRRTTAAGLASTVRSASGSES
jgi:MFS family permease